MDSVDAEIAERYELVNLAGSGGMGRVYRARDRSGGQTVALKLLPFDGGDRLRFAREATVLASLDHPAVVRYLLGGTTTEGTPYIVMEWLEGVELGLRLAQGPLDVDSTIALGTRLAGALAAAHARGVVHRDLKPANVFLVNGAVEQAKLIDFGVARQASSDELTAAGTIVGTPAYMAPEQVRGEGVDVRTDVYGLGALLFCCLTGNPPFRAPHDIAVLARIVLEEAPKLGSLRPEIGEPLAALVRRMLAKAMSDRPPDMQAVGDELRSIAQRAASVPEVEAVPSGERRVASFVLCNLGARREAQTVAIRSARPKRHAVEDLVEPFGATLHPLVRDAMIVTLRGASSPAEEAMRAARCALLIASQHPNSPIVVVTGRVVVAGDLRISDAIDRAAEAVLSRSAGGVQVDENTHDLLGERFDVRGTGKWRDVIREHETTTSGRLLLGRPAQCVGRAREMALLEGSLAECVEEGRAQVVLLTGPAGLGKSRLLHELLSTRVAPRADIELLFAQGDPVRAGSSFGIVSQLLARKAGMLESDSASTRAGKLRALIERDFGPSDAGKLEELLGEICGAYVPIDEASPELRAARADLTTMHDLVREVWVEWLRARCGAGAVVIALEDLHWADLPSLRLIDASLAALSDCPLLVVATARPEVNSKCPDVFRRRAFQEVRLGALSNRAARSLARGLLSSRIPDQVVDQLVERAAGHPFYLEELVRAVESGQRPDALPDSVLGMVQARLDDLSPGARRMLRVASVYGERFWASGVEALAAIEERADLITHLRELAEHEFIVRSATSRVRGESEWVFRHALLHDAAYAMLTDEARAVGHRLAGVWLEKVGESDPAVLAEHHFLGGAKDRARAFLVQAARRALEGNDLEAATLHCERALLSNPDEATRGVIAAILADVNFWKGDLEVSVERADEATALLPAGSSEWFAAASVAIAALGQRGRNENVAQWMKRVAEASAAPAARSAQAVALCRARTQLLWAHHPAGSELSARFADLAATPDALDPFALGWVQRVRAESAWVQERNISQCLVSFEISRIAFEAAHATRHALLTSANEASLSAWAGDSERALRIVTAAEKEATRLGAGFLSSYALAVKGLAMIYAGQAEGEATLRRAFDALGGSPRLSFICRLFCGWSALERGDVATAEADAQAALVIVVVDDLACAAHALLARVLLAKGQLQAGYEAALTGAQIRKKCGDLELTEGLTDLAFAEACEAVGNHDAAREALRAVVTRLLAIAQSIPLPEGRARFLRRRAANDRICGLAQSWGLLQANEPS
ncbi:MAG TPA: protein kinase [Polyangiaceae bacterium]|nr:protein kinase [Polyangiaceae bacterium]